MNFAKLRELMGDVDLSQFEKLPDRVPPGAEWLHSILDIYQMQASALAAEKEGQWQVAESLWERVVISAENTGWLFVLLGAKSSLAGVYAKQEKNKRALVLYIQVIELANDPRLLEELQESTGYLKMFGETVFPSMLMGALSSDADNLELHTFNLLVFGAFYKLVNIAFKLPEFPLTRLHDVLDEGLRFLETIGQIEWGHAFRSNRADLLSDQGQKQQALDEAQIALAMRQRDPGGPGYGITTHLCQVGDYLNGVGRFKDAITYLEQVAQDPMASVVMKRRAYAGLGDAYFDLGHLDLAEKMARRELQLAQETNSPVILRASYSFLSLVLSRKGKAQDASRAATQMWIFSRRQKETALEYRTYLRCAEVRLGQARSILGYDTQGELPTIVNQSISSQGRETAQHYALSAQKWLERARKPAVQLDDRAGTQERQDKIETLREEAAKVFALVVSRRAAPS